MRRRTCVLTILMVIVIAAGCSSKLKLSTVPSENVPEVMRDYAQSSGHTSVVWRAVYEQGDYLIGVYNMAPSKHPSSTASGVQWLAYSAKGLGPCVLERSEGETTEIYWAEMLDNGVHDADGVLVTDGFAYGWAFSKAATRASGVTSSGRSFDARIVNGFWLLYIPDMPTPEVFTTVVVLDKNGNKLHTHSRGAP